MALPSPGTPQPSPITHTPPAFPGPRRTPSPPASQTAPPRRAGRGPPQGRPVGARCSEGGTLNEQISEIARLIEGRFREHELADTVLSVPGIGTVLGAEFVAAVGGRLDDFDSPDVLAAYADVAPAPRDSGKVSGNLHRPIAYHRRLQRAFCTSALVSVRCDPNSRKYYDRRRAEGKSTFKPCSPSPADASTSCGL